MEATKSQSYRNRLELLNFYLETVDLNLTSAKFNKNTQQTVKTLNTMGIKIPKEELLENLARRKSNGNQNRSL